MRLKGSNIKYSILMNKNNFILSFGIFPDFFKVFKFDAASGHKNESMDNIKLPYLK